MRLTKKDLRQIRECILPIFDEWGYEFRFIKSNGESYTGLHYNEQKLIEIYYSHSDMLEEFLSTLFHELGHAYCVVYGKHVRYHEAYRIKNKKERVRVRLATCLKAERYVDNIGYKLMSDLFPTLDFWASYRDWLSVDFLKGFISGELC